MGNPPMRILCLHDQSSSSIDFHHSLRELTSKLLHRHYIKLLFIDSPLMTKEQCPSARMWFLENEPNGDQSQMLGLDASLLHIRQLWTHMMPNGVLGFGQGAAMASVMCRMSASSSSTIFPGLQFGIFLHGYNSLYRNLKEDSRIYDTNLTIHTFHAFSPEDSKGQELLTAFGGLSQDAQWHIMLSSNNITSGRTTDGHAIIRDRQLFNAIGKYLVTRKRALSKTHILSNDIYPMHPILEDITEGDKELLGSTTTMDIEPTKTVLRTLQDIRLESARLEHQTWALLNTNVALNPPKALMAAIVPRGRHYTESPAARNYLVGGMKHLEKENQEKMIGLWTGDKDGFRSEGFKEAGGAPYPSTVMNISDGMSIR